MNRMMAIVEREMRKFFRSPALLMLSLMICKYVLMLVTASIDPWLLDEVNVT